MKKRDTFAPGQWKVVCDRSGMRVHSSETTKEWNRLNVCSKYSEERHPQEFVRGVMDDMAAPDARPPGEDRFLSDNEVTADDL